MSNCPNKNSKEYQDMEAALGRNIAHYIWNRNNNHPINKDPEGNNSELFDELTTIFPNDIRRAIQEKAKIFTNSYIDNYKDWVKDYIETEEEPMVNDIINFTHKFINPNIEYPTYNDKHKSYIDLQNKQSELKNKVFKTISDKLEYILKTIYPDIKLSFVNNITNKTNSLNQRENKFNLRKAIAEYYDDLNYDYSKLDIKANNTKGFKKVYSGKRVYDVYNYFLYDNNDNINEDVDNILNTVQENYENAISKHSDYSTDLKYYIGSGNAKVYEPFASEGDHSLLAGQLVDDIFVVSHFAPESMRKGLNLINEASNSEMPIIMAVPEYLANQLEKAGFRFIIEIPQIFNGETVMKKVMVNDSTTEEDLQNLFNYYQNNFNQKNQETNRIIGQADIKAMSVLIDYLNQKTDTLPHEYAHHYIAWFRNTPIVQEAINKWGSEEALVQAIGEQVVKQEGEALNWWNKFKEWLINTFNGLKKADKETIKNALTDAFLSAEDLENSKKLTSGRILDLVDNIINNETNFQNQTEEQNAEIKYNKKEEVLAPNGKVSKLYKDIENLVKGQSNNSKVILPIGTSGSGKSTWIKSINSNNEYEVIEPDAMRVEFTGNMNDKSKNDEIYKEAAKRAVEALKNGKSIIFDTTNLKKERRRPFINAIKKEIPNANIQYKLMPLDPELAKKRIKVQLEKGENRASVSNETIDRHAKSYKQMLIDIKEEPISEYSNNKQQTLELYKQTRSKEFKDWFGDSKVVDENGEPLIVYHGTSNKNFKKFDKEFLGKNTPNDSTSSKIGFYFSKNKEVAGTYSLSKNDFNEIETKIKEKEKELKSNTIALKKTEDAFNELNRIDAIGDPSLENLSDKEAESILNVQSKKYNKIIDDNKVEADKESEEINEKLLEYTNELINSYLKDNTVIPAFLNIEDPLVSKKRNVKFDNDQLVKGKEKALSENKDGIIYNAKDSNLEGIKDFESTDNYIVFDPNQIKSVFNNGEFNKENDNIYYQKDKNVNPDEEYRDISNKLLDKISNRYNVKIKLVDINDKEGYTTYGLYNKTTNEIELNKNYIKSSTLLHEMAHPFITMLNYKDEKGFNILLNKAKKQYSEIYTKLQGIDVYNKNTNLLNEELIVRAIAEEFKTGDFKKAMSIWHKLANLIGKIFHSKLNITEDTTFNDILQEILNQSEVVKVNDKELESLYIRDILKIYNKYDKLIKEKSDTIDKLQEKYINFEKTQKPLLGKQLPIPGTPDYLDLTEVYDKQAYDEGKAYLENTLSYFKKQKEDLINIRDKELESFRKDQRAYYNRENKDIRKPIDKEVTEYDATKKGIENHIIDNFIKEASLSKIENSNFIEVENSKQGQELADQLNQKYGTEIAFVSKLLDGTYIQIIVPDKLIHENIKNRTGKENNDTRPADDLYALNDENIDPITNGELSPLDEKEPIDFKRELVSLKRAINKELNASIKQFIINKRVATPEEKQKINKEIVTLKKSIENNEAVIRELTDTNRDLTGNAYKAIAKQDIDLIKNVLFKNVLGNKDKIADIIRFYKSAGTFEVDKLNPMFNSIKDLRDSLADNTTVNDEKEALREIINDFQVIKKQFVALENDLKIKLEDELNKVILNNQKIQNLDTVPTIESMTAPTEDISLWDMLMHNISINTFSKDSLIAQLMMDELRKSMEDKRADIIQILNRLDLLQPAIEKKLKKIKKKGVSITSFDILFQRDGKGFKTGRLVHLFNNKWFENFHDTTSIDFSNKDNLNNKMIDRNQWLGKYAHAIDISKLSEIADAFKDDSEFKDNFKADDKYRHNLIKLLGIHLYNDFIETNIDKIKEFKIWKQDKYDDYVKRYGTAFTEPLQRKFEEEVELSNPFSAFKAFNEKGGIVLANNTKAIYNPNYITFIPKKQVTVEDYETGNIKVVPTDFYDSDFEAIKNDEDIHNYWKEIANATKYINEVFSDNGISLPFNSLPAMEKTFIEYMADNEVKGGVFAKGKVLYKQFMKGLRKLITVDNDESIKASDIKGINRNVRDKRLNEYHIIRQKLTAEWNSITEYTDKEVLVKDLTDKETKFIAKLLDTYPNRSSIGTTLKSETINVGRLINRYTNNQIISDSSHDIPRLIRTSLVLASEYAARKEIEPTLSVFKEYYDNITRDTKIKGKKSALDTFLRNKIGSGKGEEERAFAKKRMEFGYNKGVRGQFNKEASGVFKGFGFKVKEDRKHFKKFLTFLSTGKIFTNDELKELDSLKAILPKLEDRLKNEFKLDITYNPDGTIPFKQATPTINPKKINSVISSYNSTLKSIENQGKRIAFSSIANTLFSALIFKGLAYNISGAITNRLEGKMANMIIDGTGLYWTPGNMSKAELFVSQGFRKRISKKDGYKQQWDILKHIIEDYRILQDASNEMQKNSVKSTFKHVSKLAPYDIAVSSIEFRNQGADVIAMLMDIDIKDKYNVSHKMFKDGKFTAFEIYNDSLRLKDNFRTKENIDNWENISGNTYKNFKTNILQVISTIHGDYENIGGMLLKNSSVGKSLAIYKTWLPAQIWQRLGKEQVLLGTKTGTFKGRWRSLTPLTGGMLGATSGLIGGPLLTLVGGIVGTGLGALNNIHSEIGFIKELSIVSTNILKKTLLIPLNMFGIGKKLGTVNVDKLSLSPIDTANMKANITDISILLSMILLKLFISSLRAGDGDDDKKKLKHRIYLLFENKLMNSISNATYYTRPKIIYDSYTQTSVYKWLSDVGTTLNDLQKSVFEDLDTKQKDSIHSKIDRDYKRLFVPAFINGLGLGNYMKTDWTSDFFDKKIITEPAKRKKEELKKEKAKEKKKQKASVKPKSKKKKELK